MTLTIDDTIYFNEPGTEGGEHGSDNGFPGSSGSDMLHFTRTSDGPVESNSVDIDVVDPWAFPTGGGDDGSESGPVTSNEGSDGWYDGDNDGTPLAPEHQPVEEGFMFG